MSSPQLAAPARHLHRMPPLSITMLGTAGLPATEDGPATVAQEVGRRLVAGGHAVRVYGRGPGPREHLGMRAVRLPARLPSLAATLLSAAHLDLARRQDVALVFGTANASLIPLLRARGTAVALHIDAPATAGSSRALRSAEQAAVREADALVAGTRDVQRHYADEFGVPVELMPYGARILTHEPTDRIEALGLVPGNFHLVVARFAAGDLDDVVVEGFRRSHAAMPLAVAGAAPRGDVIGDRLRRLAERDPRIRLLGDVRDPRTLDQLHAHALSSLHGPTAGATSALIRAMGAGTAVVAFDVEANRDAAGTAASWFTTAAELAVRLEEVERYPFRFRDIGELMQERARRGHGWDAVTEGFEALAAKLARGWSIRGMSDGRRIGRAIAVPGGGVHVRA